jgi:hypothetical protein
MVSSVTYNELYSWLFLMGKLTVGHPKLYSTPTDLFAKSPDSLQ